MNHDAYDGEVYKTKAEHGAHVQVPAVPAARICKTLLIEVARSYHPDQRKGESRNGKDGDQTDQRRIQTNDYRERDCKRLGEV